MAQGSAPMGFILGNYFKRAYGALQNKTRISLKEFSDFWLGLLTVSIPESTNSAGESTNSQYNQTRSVQFALNFDCSFNAICDAMTENIVESELKASDTEKLRKVVERFAGHFTIEVDQMIMVCDDRDDMEYLVNSEKPEKSNEVSSMHDESEESGGSEESGSSGDSTMSSVNSTKSALDLVYRKSRNEKREKVRKEFFRVQHIRGMKKSIRQFVAGQKPISCIHRVQSGDTVAMGKYVALKEYFESYTQSLVDISATDKGPKTDGKARRSPDESASSSRSFNNHYCKSFFSQPLVREYFRLYCDLVYSPGPEEMCEKMRIWCCGKQYHTESCREVWKRVHQYAVNGMLHELGLPSAEQPSGNQPRFAGYSRI